jgi:hypothetical protein
MESTMKIIRNLALAGIVAVGAALASGSASAHHGFGPGFGPGFGHGFHKSRLCYVPFFKLVQWFGYWQAKRIKYRCYYRYYY